MKQRSRRQFQFRKKAPRIGRILLRHQIIPPARFSALSDDEKYAFLVLGHVYNELSWLQRTAILFSKSRPKGEIQINGAVSQTLTAARLFLGKLNEFRILLNDQPLLKRFIVDHFDNADRPHGQRALDELMALFDGNPWLHTARNKHFLHYPKKNDVIDTILDTNINWEPEILHGEESANTLFPTSDVLGNYSWFRLADGTNPVRGLQDALKAAKELCGASLHIIERSLALFVNARMHPLSEYTEVELYVPKIEDINIDFFMDYESLLQKTA